jgi:hypothetical protein
VCNYRETTERGEDEGGDREKGIRKGALYLNTTTLWSFSLHPSPEKTDRTMLKTP